MGIALPLFCESETELLISNFLDNVEGKFCTIKSCKRVLPDQSEVLNVKQIDRSAPAIDQEVCFWAEYKIKILILLKIPVMEAT